MAPAVKRWRDSVKAAIDVWPFLPPLALGFEAERIAIANSGLVGQGLPAVASAAIVIPPRACERRNEFFPGPWRIASPWGRVLNTTAIFLGGVGTNGARRQSTSFTAKNKRIDFDCSIPFSSTTS